MKKAIILSFSSILSIGSIYSQDVSYTYDNAGNRIKREPYIELQSQNKRLMAATEEQSLIIPNEIKIYPNPTDGLFKIEISGLNENDGCEMSVCSLSGQILLVRTDITQIVEIDIRQYPAGIYLLNITLNDEKSVWKIIKK